MMDATTERWAIVPGQDDCYEVSDHGRVRSVDRTITDSRGRVLRLRGRMLRPATVKGRQSVVLRFQKSHLIHRLVLESFVGPPPEGHECCHNDGDSMNNHLSNLRWDTHEANMDDVARHGTHWALKKCECPRGHALVVPNLVQALYARKGHRVCRACTRAESNLRRGRRSGTLQSEGDREFRRIMDSGDHGAVLTAAARRTQAPSSPE